jgi:UDP-N-acetylmuramate dehydrogenase
MKKYNDFDLTSYNSYGIRSTARLAIFPESVSELIHAIGSYERKILIGGGNNIILSKQYYDLPIIFCGQNMKDYEVESNRFTVSCGVSMQELSNMVADKGYSGFETFYDIPGCIGGGIYMNAGAGEQFISDHIVSVEAWDVRNREMKSYTKEECRFGYRNSVFKDCGGLVILRGTFSFDSVMDCNQIRKKMNEIKLKRWAKQPREYPNAGSVFKRPKGRFVGPMIEQLGLKGYSIGDACVSEKHAGFIVNKGHAKGSDIISLVKYIQRKVYDSYGVQLQLEQVII